MDKKTLLAGGLMLASGSYFFYQNYKDNDSSVMESIKGVNLEIRPDDIVDGLKPFVKMNPILKEGGASLLKKFIARKISDE